MVELSVDAAATLCSKSKINKIGKLLIENPPANEAIAGIRYYRMFRLSCLNECINRVLEAAPPTYSLLSARLKRLRSIHRKLARNKIEGFTAQLSRMDDVIGIRVICDHFSEALAFSERLAQQGTRVKDYVSMPQETGYRAIHHILNIEQFLPSKNHQPLTFTFEVQIRTYFQNQWGVWCESFGESAKENSAPDDVQEHLRKLSRKIQKWEENHHAAKQNDLPPIVTSRNYNLAIVSRATEGKYSVYVTESSLWRKALTNLFNQEVRNPLNEDIVLLAGFSNHSNLVESLKISHPTRFVPNIRVPIDIKSNSHICLVFD